MEAPQTENRIDSVFTEDELIAIEEQNPDGLSSGEIVEIFMSKGERFSEATFRKYVQLGLLPRSRRVGSKGKHKGSRGVYPAGVVRQINEIKRMMSLDYTIEDICRHFAFVGGEIEELRTLLSRVIERLEGSLDDDQSATLASLGLRQQIGEVREVAESFISRLEEIATNIREFRQLAREAV